MIVDCAVYDRGLRKEGVVALDEAMEVAERLGGARAGLSSRGGRGDDCGSNLL